MFVYFKIFTADQDLVRGRSSLDNVEMAFAREVSSHDLVSKFFQFFFSVKLMCLLLLLMACTEISIYIYPYVVLKSVCARWPRSKWTFSSFIHYVLISWWWCSSIFCCPWCFQSNQVSSLSHPTWPTLSLINDFYVTVETHSLANFLCGHHPVKLLFQISTFFSFISCQISFFIVVM